MGDPAGVGPEICLKLLQNKDIAKICTPIIFGSFSVLTQAATAMLAQANQAPQGVLRLLQAG